MEHHKEFSFMTNFANGCLIRFHGEFRKQSDSLSSLKRCTACRGHEANMERERGESD